VQHYKAGFEAAGMMVETIENESTEVHHVVLPVETIVRNSTARFRGKAEARSIDMAGEQA
jgi:DNA-binding LacI/PurR family transcriptional regulator